MRSMHAFSFLRPPAERPRGRHGRKGSGLPAARPSARRAKPLSVARDSRPPARVVFLEQRGGPGPVIPVTASPFGLDLRQRITHHTVATREDGTIGTDLVEA